MSKDNYHILMIFQRKKDNPNLRKSTVCIFQDCLKAKHILERKEMYAKIAKDNNARVYVSVNPVDMKKARKDLAVRLIQTDFDETNETSIVRLCYSSCMRCPKKEGKRFLIDVDTKSALNNNEVMNLIPKGTHTYVVETPNGYHYLTEPFDVRIFENTFNVEVKKDGMTYIPYLEMIYNE